jgi:hypothetical protein
LRVVLRRYSIGSSLTRVRPTVFFTTVFTWHAAGKAILKKKCKTQRKRKCGLHNMFSEGRRRNIPKAKKERDYLFVFQIDSIYIIFMLPPNVSSFTRDNLY